MPIIAVTPSWDNATKKMIVNQDYINAVTDAGGMPLVIPPVADEKGLLAALDCCDGLLLTGGDDVCPTLYGEEILPCCGDLTHERDFAEPVLIRGALERGLPILGICRGIEILNVALGGALYQDIALQYSEQIKHPCYDIPADDAHAMNILPGTLLRQVIGMDQCMVNSRHHQAVKRVAEGFRICAKAPDGLIEGIEIPELTYFVGVQWHPERMIEDPKMRGLFEHFVEASSKRRDEN